MDLPKNSLSLVSTWANTWGYVGAFQVNGFGSCKKLKNED